MASARKMVNMAIARRVNSWPVLLFTAFCIALSYRSSGLAADRLQPVTIEIVAQGKVIRSASTTIYGDRVLASTLSDGGVVAPMSTVLALFAAKAVVDRKSGAITIVGDGHRLSFTIDRHAAMVDGRPTELSIPPRVIGNAVLLPLRATATAFGADVAWLPERRTVIVEPPSLASTKATPQRPSQPTSGPMLAPTGSPGTPVTCCCCKENCCQQTKHEDTILTAPWELPALSVLVELLLFALLINYRWRRNLTWLLFAQLFIGLLGVVGATLHAFPVERTADTQYPLVDASTASWIALVVIAYFMPRIAKLKWFNTEVEVRDEVKDTASLFEKSSENWADILQNWSQAIAIFIAQCEETPDLRTMLLMNFVRDRMGEAKVLLLPQVPEDEAAINASPVDVNQVRLSAWIYDPKANTLRFFWSNEIVDPETQKATFAPGTGLVGQAFLEGRLWNEADAEAVPGFIKISGQPRIGGVICAPIWLRERSKPAGMITADRPTVGKFSDINCDIVKALAALIAIAWRVAQA